MGPASSIAKMFRVLGALDGALAAARAAVLAAHPELLSSHSDELPAFAHSPGPLKLSAASWVGDEILTHIAGLSEALERYSLAVEMERPPLLGQGRAA